MSRACHATGAQAPTSAFNLFPICLLLNNSPSISTYCSLLLLALLKHDWFCRFNDVFTRDEQGLPCNWSPSANIPAIAQQARQSAAKLLALLAVIRLHSVKVEARLYLVSSAHFLLPKDS